jgi:hypothetical protein
MENNMHFLSYFVQFFLEGEMLKTKFVQKIEHTVYIPFFIENRALY